MCWQGLYPVELAHNPSRLDGRPSIPVAIKVKGLNAYVYGENLRQHIMMLMMLSECFQIGVAVGDINKVERNAYLQKTGLQVRSANVSSQFLFVQKRLGRFQD